MSHEQEQSVSDQQVRVAVIPGDGIGKEVTAEGLKVLAAVAPGRFVTTEYALGAEHYLATGDVLPEDTLTAIKGYDAILLGAVGGKPNDPNLPPGLLERGLLLKLRFELDHYVNLRPSRIYPGAVSPLADPGEIDFVVVREGTEGPYTGNGGSLRVGTAQEVATEVSVNTAFGVERVVRDAFRRAQKRRKKLTLVHKTNVLVHAGQVWWRLTQAVATEFPDVTVDYMHIDAAMIFMTTDPARFDVIVTDNLFGDLLSDLAAMLTGSLGMLPSASLGAPMANGRPKALYEPVHGSAPDIAGQGKANPIACILSFAMALRYSFDQGGEAERLEKAVEKVLADGVRTADLMGPEGGKPVSTSEMGDRIVAALDASL